MTDRKRFGWVKYIVIYPEIFEFYAWKRRIYPDSMMKTQKYPEICGFTIKTDDIPERGWLALMIIEEVVLAFDTLGIVIVHELRIPGEQPLFGVLSDRYWHEGKPSRDVPFNAHTDQVRSIIRVGMKLHMICVHWLPCGNFTSLGKITTFNGKTRNKWLFSIVMIC